ncbi:MAG: nucleotidyltransferase domain-containing protein [Bacteroidetes bacterium]|nr:nucleotidyltransferase domain-containing protein [Bacteroidota bacterium]
MLQQIQSKLTELSEERGIKILHACESGSRAWGFPSPDSDYDVRFIYVHPRDWYLSIENSTDNINIFFSKDLDFNAWDIRKALGLLRKSNATPFEWLQSPIVYRESPGFADKFRSLFEEYFAPKALTHHYLGICTSSLKSVTDSGVIKLKKYFYVLRPLLAAKWIVDGKGVPPMEFGKLMAGLDDQPVIKQIIDELLEIKKEAAEDQTIHLIPELQRFIEKEWNRCDALAGDLPKKKSDPDSLNQFFRQLLG